MNAKDCFAANEYEEQARETIPLFDEKKCHKTKKLESEVDLDEEFDVIRSMN